MATLLDNSSWPSLPLEVLSLIMGFVPTRRRFLIVSLVCKRWRKAVQQTPVHVHKMSTSQLRLALRNVFCDSMHCVSKIDCPAPTTLRTLVVGHLAIGTCFCLPFCVLTGLTSLELLNLGSSSRCDCYISLLRQNASLAQLTIRVWREFPPAADFVALFSTLRLSSLSSLRLICSSGIARKGQEPALASFVHAHSTQLRSLTVLGNNALLDSGSFPLLSRLEIASIGRARFASLHERCPALRSLVLHTDSGKAALSLTQLVPLLTSAYATQTTLVTLVQCSNLRSLHIRDSALLTTTLLRLAPMLTMLDVESGTLDSELLAQMTSLTRLRIRDPHLPADLRLTQLRTLHLVYSVDVQDRGSFGGLLDRIGTSFPSLTVLSLRINGTSRREVTLLNAFFAAQEVRRVLHRVYVFGCKDFVPADLKTTHYKWLDVRTNFEEHELAELDVDSLE